VRDIIAEIHLATRRLFSDPENDVMVERLISQSQFKAF